MRTLTLAAALLALSTAFLLYAVNYDTRRLEAEAATPRARGGQAAQRHRDPEGGARSPRAAGPYRAARPRARTPIR